MFTFLKFVILLLFYFFIWNEFVIFATGKEEWRGKWFPYPPASFGGKIILKSHMGLSNSECDDGKLNLTMDWNLNPLSHTCFVRERIYPDGKVKPYFVKEIIPPMFEPAHVCMDTKLVYDTPIPTFGAHRPIWPKYGEYKFIPPQRWLHSLEHGAIVMLYHPCSDKNEVNTLRKLVQSCLYRHIITPHLDVSVERNLVLVAWGYRLEMSKVAPDLVQSFIQDHALKGPEKISDDGLYDYMLQRPAKLVSNVNDGVLCPAPSSIYNVPES